MVVLVVVLLVVLLLCAFVSGGLWMDDLITWLENRKG